jgi:hypothetical protein
VQFVLLNFFRAGCDFWSFECKISKKNFASKCKKKIFLGIFSVKHQGKILLKQAKEKVFFGIFSVKHQRKILQIL